MNPASLLRPHHRQIAALVLFSLGVSALSLAQPWLMKLLVDDGLLARNFDDVLRYALVIFAVALMASLAGGVNRWFYTRLSGQMLFELRERVYAHLQRLSPTFFVRNRSGDVLARLDGDVAEIQRFALDSLFAGISGVFGLIGTLMLMFALSPQLSLIALAVIPLEWLWLRSMRGRMREQASTVRGHASDISSFLVETIPAMKYIQGAAATGREHARLRVLNGAYLDGLLRLQLVELATAAVPASIGAAGRLIVFLFGGWLVIEGYFALGSLLAFTSYLGMAMGPVQSLLGVYMGFNRVRVSLERVRQLTDAQPDVVNSGTLLPPPQGFADIAFDAVGFGHDGESMLENIRVHIPNGARVGVFGPSGSGKTTLIDLLLRHHDPHGGRILLAGRDLRDYELDAWRRRVALVGQEIVLFRGSILDNLRYSCPEATEQAACVALERAQLGDFLARQAQGLATQIGERGARLSGGERQRLAIARAILQDPLLLLFDEATSSLDPATESELLHAIDRLFPGVTRIVVSHRERPLDGADLLLELRDGQMHEVGR